MDMVQDTYTPAEKELFDIAEIAQFGVLAFMFNETEIDMNAEHSEAEMELHHTADTVQEKAVLEFLREEMVMSKG